MTRVQAIVLVAVCICVPIIGSSVCIAVHANIVAVFTFPLVLSAVFVDVVPLFIVVVVVCVGFSGVLLCTESVLSISFSSFPNLILLLFLHS